MSLAVSGGTGYADSTPFTSSGGGTHCTVAGNMLASAGVPRTLSYTANGYCTSVPTINLAGSAGNGATISAALLNTSIMSSEPWYLNGDADGVMAKVAFLGSSTRTFDDFAILPEVAPAWVAQDLALYTNASRAGLAAVCAKRPNVVIIEDGDEDWDNWGLVAAAVSAHKLGCINLVGVEDTQGGATVEWYRQALDEAGLAHVAVAQTPQSTSPCGGTNANWTDEPGYFCGQIRGEGVAEAGYDANYRQRVSTGVMTDVQMYTQVLSKYSNVNIVSGAGLNGVYDLMLSPGGVALFQSKVAAIYQQEGGCTDRGWAGNLAFGMVASEYVLAHNGEVPIYFFGGDVSCMPGWIQAVQDYTRGVNDPWNTFDVVYGGGGDSRTPFDSWGFMGMLLPGLFEVSNGPGTMTLSGTLAEGNQMFSFSPLINSHHYQMRYSGPQTNFPAVLNSLINMNPNLPVGTPQ